MSGAVDPHTIDQWLPQTQCQRCGYPGCWDYALAIAAQSAPINRCPPGGNITLRALAEITGKPLVPLDPNCGTTGPLACAVINEELCIGCTLCIQACPVDAIAGASKLMHTVIGRECTGCELCIAPCPMDCIQMTPITGIRSDNEDASPWPEYSSGMVVRARRRAEIKRSRSQLSAESFDRKTTWTQTVIRQNILSSVKRSRARRSSLFFKKD
ncbi:MAG TPA: RnfABCDGE type electron transport complex subunit B [Gammaproteobacteria bacterium]|nr:RnfABCDGE type electron transport complex subunit B [Gammaproteobacteria bacterium]